jgi:hypothetical protein
MPHDQVIQNGRLIEQVSGLEGAANPPLGDVVAAQRRDVLPVEDDPPGAGLLRTAHQVEKGALAGPVGADDRVDLVGLELDGNILNRRQTTEHLGQVLDFKHCC